MQQTQVAEAVPVPGDLCPPALRRVVNRWKQGKATNAELIEASFEAQLALCQAGEYRCRPLPTPPDRVTEFRAMSRGDRNRVDEATKTRLVRDYSKFFADEGQLVTRNRGSLATLRELLAWAQAKPLAEQELAQIQQQIDTHQRPVSVDADDEAPF